MEYILIITISISTKFEFPITAVITQVHYFDNLFAFNAFTPLVWYQQSHFACKNYRSINFPTIVVSG